MGGGKEKKLCKRFPHILKTRSTAHLKDVNVFCDVCIVALDKLRTDVVDIMIKDERERFAGALCHDFNFQISTWRYAVATDSLDVLRIIYEHVNFYRQAFLLPVDIGPNHIQVMTDDSLFDWRAVKRHMHVFNCRRNGLAIGKRNGCWCQTQQAQDVLGRALSRRRKRIDMVMQCLRKVVAERNLRLAIVAQAIIEEARSGDIKLVKHMHVEDMDVFIIARMFHLSEDVALGMSTLELCRWIESQMTF